MKKAFIVTFEAATRVVIDTDELDYKELMCETNIEEDTEEPYDPKYDG